MAELLVRRFEDAASLSRAAAELFAELARASVAERGRFGVALSGGGTPQDLFSLLAQPPFRDTLPWPDSHFFWGDERLVPPADEGSNYREAYRLWLQHIAVPAANIHRARGELAASAAVADYTAQLRRFAADGRDDRQRWPRLDLVLLGMGEDGHTASLFPGPITVEERQQGVMAVTATYQNRPAQRLTLTPLLLNGARHILFLVSGAAKAQALAAVLEGPSQPEQWPAQRIAPKEGSVTWFVDEAAAAQLNYH